MKKANRKTLSFGESLDLFEANFLRMDLDEQFEFLEKFVPTLAEMENGFQVFVLMQLVSYLEKQMFINLGLWLESEFED